MDRRGPSQENIAPKGSMRFRDRAAVSICIHFLITSVGVVMRRPVFSSLEMERSVGKKGGVGKPCRVSHNEF
jgi:hypothetical protein